MKIRPYAPTDESAVIELWRACDLVRPWNDPAKDIARKLRVNPEWFLVAEQGGRVVGSVMVGYEGHRGWINYLAVDPARQRGGLGRRLMAEAERIRGRRVVRRSTCRCGVPTRGSSRSMSGSASRWTTSRAWASGWSGIER